jgi:glycosyltransferase involved in cell wall biosynthesis
VLGCGTVDLRKGADLFVNVARRVLLDASSSAAPLTFFVWVGHGNEEKLRRWLLHDARTGGLGDRIRLIRPRTSAAPYYMAADVLALTSREDPCPLVNMEAMESGLAVVAFLGAGGAPEVLGDAGVCVPYIDTEAMAAAVRGLLSDDEKRHAMGRRGQTRIRERFTWDHFMQEFLDTLKTDFHYRPWLRQKSLSSFPITDTPGIWKSGFRAYSTRHSSRTKSSFSTTRRPTRALR